MKKIGFLSTVALCLSPDFAEGVDPLDVKVDDIDTSRPVLHAKIYDLRIVSAKVEPTKNNDGQRITIIHETTEPLKSTKNEDVAAGHRITKFIGITPREARMIPDGKGGEKLSNPYTNQDIAKALAAVGKAAGLSATPRDIIANPSMLDGKVVRCKVGIDKETADFPENNSIKDYQVIR